MKVFLASFFLLIFSLQIVPVKEVGKILFKQMLTEEIHEADCDEEHDCNALAVKFKKDNDPYTSLKYYMQCEKWLLINNNKLTIGNKKHFAKQFTPDILTPPPNC